VALRVLIDELLGKGLAGSTVHGCVTATSSLLRLAVRRGVIEVNPVRFVERGDRPSVKRRKEPRYLNRQQLDLLSKLSDESRRLLCFGDASGNADPAEACLARHLAPASA
jgi:site-specific recombinase XerC